MPPNDQMQADGAGKMERRIWLGGPERERRVETTRLTSLPLDLGVGRVRHLYVVEAFRRQSIGQHLLESIVAEARGVFHELRLRTDSEHAARFYERFGFRGIHGEAATHALTLGSPTAPQNGEMHLKSHG